MSAKRRARRASTVCLEIRHPGNRLLAGRFGGKSPGYPVDCPQKSGTGRQASAAVRPYRNGVDDTTAHFTPSSPIVEETLRWRAKQCRTGELFRLLVGVELLQKYSACM